MKRVLAFLLLGVVFVLWWLIDNRPAPSDSRKSSEPPASAPTQPATAPASISETAPPAEHQEVPPSSGGLTGQITRALASGSATERDHALNVLLPCLVAADPAAAGHLALAWEPGLMREELLRRVIELWSESDIGAVLTWLTSLLDSADRSVASVASTAQVARTDPAGALELAQALRVGLDDGSFERMAQLWTEEHPAEAVDWAINQPRGPVRDRLLARVAHVRAQQEPAEAARLVMEHMAPSAARDTAILAVVRQWALRDPAGATLWAEQFPPGSLHTRAVKEIESVRKLAR